MRDKDFLDNVIGVVDDIARDVPSDAQQYADKENRVIFGHINKLFEFARRYREWQGDKRPTTRETHVGKSNYSANAIQPWTLWIDYALNPWDSDMVKRLLRTKEEPGMTAAESRILDYQKIQHICQERIDQINNGDPYYVNLRKVLDNGKS